MTKDASFVIDFKETITREELVELIDHALACVCGLPNTEDINFLREGISEPLTLLHNTLYYAKRNDEI